MNKLITILPVFLAVLVTGCSYGSYYEASEACREWSDNGKPYKRTNKWNKNIDKANSRYCRDEDRTNQILGFERVGIKRGRTYDSSKLLDSKVTKRFRY